MCIGARNDLRLPAFVDEAGVWRDEHGLRRDEPVQCVRQKAQVSRGRIAPRRHPIHIGKAMVYSPRVNMTVAFRSVLPRWLAIVGLLLFLVFVFSSQLYWSGNVTPWTRAFGQEAVYWSSWALLTPAIFWMCRRLYSREHLWSRYTPGVLFGAVASCVLQPLLAEVAGLALPYVREWLAASVSVPRFGQRAIRLAGINLPVYAGLVLAWHASTYYRELRSREMQALHLESLLHQSQLQALRSQLNPHFLFNTLHSIAELVHEDPRRAEQMILRLGELLRQVLDTAALPEVPLEEELAFVRRYVEIEQMRLGDRLTVEWRVEPETLQGRVPSLLLQPLVRTRSSTLSRRFCSRLILQSARAETPNGCICKCGMRAPVCLAVHLVAAPG